MAAFRFGVRERVGDVALTSGPLVWAVTRSIGAWF